ncbi:MAG TPA: CAP domain-containing protein [Tepidiformaceae bacterium]
MTQVSTGTQARLPSTHSRAGIFRGLLLLATALSLAVAGVETLRGFQPITDSRTDAAFTDPSLTAVQPTSEAPSATPAPDPPHSESAGWAGSIAPAAAVNRPDFYLPMVEARQLSAIEEALAAAVNGARKGASLPTLTVDDGLSHIALIRANQMANQSYLGTTDPAGYTMFSELLTRAGYSYTWAGENLDADNYSVASSPSAALAAFLATEPTRENLLSSAFNRMGVGEVTAPDGRHLYAVVFVG